jgi:hypothetical protein
MTELAEALLNSTSRPPPGHVALVSHLLIDVLTPGQLAVLPTASARSAAAPPRRREPPRCDIEAVITATM